MPKQRIIIVVCLVSFLLGAIPGLCADFPSQADTNSQLQESRPGSAQLRYDGYVPPPPIRHTWPGGYKVIFHEMMNTLMDHIVGQY